MNKSQLPNWPIKISTRSKIISKINQFNSYLLRFNNQTIRKYIKLNFIGDDYSELNDTHHVYHLLDFNHGTCKIFKLEYNYDNQVYNLIASDEVISTFNVLNEGIIQGIINTIKNYDELEFNSTYALNLMDPVIRKIFTSDINK